MIAFDPRQLSWERYNALMNELFASNSLGVVEEKNWKDWAKRFVGIEKIMRSGVPEPSLFDDWRKWAERLTGTLSVGKL